MMLGNVSLFMKEAGTCNSLPRTSAEAERASPSKRDSYVGKENDGFKDMGSEAVSGTGILRGRGGGIKTDWDMDRQVSGIW